MTIKTNIALLRKNFHLSLAKKRGLLINAEDLPENRMFGTDDLIQKHLERVSFWRALTLFAKNDNT